MKVIYCRLPQESNRPVADIEGVDFLARTYTNDHRRKEP